MLTVILHYSNWNCSRFLGVLILCRFDNVVFFLFHHGTAAFKQEVFGIRGDGCASGTEIMSQSRTRGFLVRVGYHTWSWGGSCLNTGSCKNKLYILWNNQIWEGGSQSQSALLEYGNLQQRKRNRYLRRRQFSAKEGDKTICYMLNVCVSLEYTWKAAETPCSKLIDFICYFAIFNKK